MTFSNVQVDNASGTIEATDSGSLISLSEADIVGGTIESGSPTSAADGVIEVGAGSEPVFFDGATDGTLTVNAYVQVDDGGSLELLGAIDNAGTIVLGSESGAELLISGPVTLSGSGTISLEGASIFTGAGDPSDELINAGNTISGSGTIEDLTLDNQSGGVIDATGGMLTIDTGNTVTNAGLFEATSGGILQIDDTIANSGSILADGGKVDIVGSVTANASLDGSAMIEAGGTLEIGLSDAQPVNYSGTGGTLVLDNPADFSGQIEGLALGNIIDLKNTTFSSTAISGSTLTVTESNGSQLTYQVSGSLSGNYLAIQSDGAGGDELVLSPGGTAISLTDVTPGGSTDLDAGKTITFTLDTSEAVNAVGSSLTLSNGATAAYASGSGTEALTFTYTVASGDAGADGPQGHRL